MTFAKIIFALLEHISHLFVVLWCIQIYFCGGPDIFIYSCEPGNICWTLKLLKNIDQNGGQGKPKHNKQ